MNLSSRYMYVFVHKYICAAIYTMMKDVVMVVPIRSSLYVL